MKTDKDMQRAKMTGWFDPKVMSRTAIMLATANIFGRHSDTRLIEALSNQPQSTFDYSPSDGDFWLDYVADIGDGWNSTHTVAQAIAREQLAVSSHDGPEVMTQSGSVLVFGGDEVYPYPSRDRYALCTENPYRSAFAGRHARPDLFAIPGNHDWYDSLVAFSRCFCRPERSFAGCRTRQTRSYFALRLPANWWLLGIDLQLGADLDEPQVRYFQGVARELDETARIILCAPEPQWIYEAMYPGHASYESSQLKFFEREILNREIKVFIGGDLHFYKRHENAAGVQKIVSGGGGAFLHPTHQPETKRIDEGFEQQAEYPSAEQSRRLAWRNLRFPLLNPRAAWLPALVYALSAWFASASLQAEELTSFGSAFHAALVGAIRDPVNGIWLLSITAGLIFFTDTHERWYRVIGGATHALLHLFAAFVLAWTSLLITVHVLGMSFGSVLQLLASGALTFVAGGVVGSFIVGVYLLISLQVFGRHSTEAFSSLRVQDWKHWLRLRVDANGDLTIFVIAIDRVVKRWQRADQGHEESWESVDPRATPPRLIDRVSVR
ncbi:MAG: hypothetical protein ABIT36_12465 [Steroidobacteraceae bacterium]